jgi:hypothetical protein
MLREVKRDVFLRWLSSPVQQTQSQGNVNPVSVAIKHYIFFKEKGGSGNKEQFSQLRNK